MTFPARMLTTSAPILRGFHAMRGLSVLTRSSLRLRPPTSSVRQLSTSSLRRAQYTRFPSEDSEQRHSPRGVIDSRMKIVIALAAIGGTYYVVQYVSECYPGCCTSLLIVKFRASPRDWQVAIYGHKPQV